MKKESKLSDGRIEIYICGNSDGYFFREIAKTIENNFDITWLVKAEGLGIDQRYWDFEIDGVVITLHLEHYLGISIFPHEKTKNMDLANSLVKKIASYVSQIDQFGDYK